MIKQRITIHIFFNWMGVRRFRMCAVNACFMGFAAHLIFYLSSSKIVVCSKFGVKNGVVNGVSDGWREGVLG